MLGGLLRSAREPPGAVPTDDRAYGTHFAAVVVVDPDINCAHYAHTTRR